MAAKIPPPSESADKFMLRLPDGARERLRAAARANGRSMNSEILARLAASWAEEFGAAAVTARLEALQRQLDVLVAMVARLEKKAGKGGKGLWD